MKLKALHDASGRPLVAGNERGWGGSKVLILDGPYALTEGRVHRIERPNAEVDITPLSSPYGSERDYVTVRVRDPFIVDTVHGHTVTPTPSQIAFVDVLHLGRDVLSANARRKLAAEWGKRYAEAQVRSEAQEDMRRQQRAKSRAEYAEYRTSHPVQDLNTRIQDAATRTPYGFAGEFRSTRRVLDTTPIHPGAGPSLTNREFARYTVVARRGDYHQVYALCADHKTAFATYSQGDAREQYADRGLWCPGCAESPG